MNVTRALLFAGLGALMMGPAPGESGGCSSDGSEEIADFFDFYQESRGYVCLRDRARGEAVDIQECVNEVARTAETIGGWPFDCQPFPTQREADGCVAELMRADNIELQLEDIPECTLCP